MLTTTATAPLLIKAFEGFRSQTYFDSAGVPTIGFGVTTYSNGDPVMPGDEITEDEAEAELFHHIRNEVEPVMNLHFENLPLQPNQRDALASFLYNLGGNSDKWPSLKKAIEKGKSDEKIADQWMRYTRAGGKVVLGLHRRRLAEVLVWLGIPWQRAVDLSQEAGLDDGWRDYAPQQVSEPEPDAEPVKTGEQIVADLNNAQLQKLGGKPVPMTQITKKVPVEAVEYLEEVDKTPGNITVKRMEDSKRGKGFAKTEQGKQQIIVGAGGSAAVAIGAAEPVVSFVERYSVNTIAIVFLGLTAIGIVTYYWGQWQREKGEDEAEDLLG